MAFEANIAIQGLFRLHPDNPDNPTRLLAVAPWVRPDSDSVCAHHLVVRWKPYQTGVNVPSSVLTLWKLEGARISFDFAGDGDLEVDLDNLLVPRMFATRNANGQIRPATGILPPEPEYLQAAEIKAAALAEPGPGQFAFRMDSGGKRLRENNEGVMGQVLIDKGEVLAGDFRGVPRAAIEPSLWPDGQGARIPYNGQFVNRINISTGEIPDLTINATDLVEGVSVGSLVLEADPDRLAQGQKLEVEILHLCGDALVDPTPEDPEVIEQDNVDEDFSLLYRLSRDENGLRTLIRQRFNGQLPRPIRHGRPASDGLFECGKVIG